MKLKILGSVSPYAKGEKNEPGYFISNGKNKILLDCGEGSTRWMDMNHDLENLNVIISHYHYDHYSALQSLAYASYTYHNLGMLSSKVKVFLPKPEETDDNQLSAYQFLRNMNHHYMDFLTYDENTKLEIGDMRVSFTKTLHEIPCYAARVEHFKHAIVYSSDTGFSPRLFDNFANRCHLFICESTFLKGQTKGKNFHLYASEAAILAKRLEVNQLILSHFWPEIDKNLYLKEARSIFTNTEVAEEGKIYLLK